MKELLSLSLACAIVLSAGLVDPSPARPGLGDQPTPRVSGDDRDTVTLKNGKERKGRVVLELDDRIILRVGTREVEIERDKIDKVDAILHHLDRGLDMLREGIRAPADLLALAKYCDDHGLPHEATLLRWLTLFDDPDNAEAHTALGHEQRRGDAWHLRDDDRRWRTLEDAEKRHADWGKAWTMRSEHFAVRCDTGVERTVHTLFELEYAYRAFRQTFLQPLELRAILEPIQVYIFKNQKQFPSLGTSTSAFFATDENILYTFVAGRGRPTALFHEGMHAILYNTAENSAQSRGTLPAWLDEGWADFMEGAMVPEGKGRARFEPTRRYRPRIATLAAGEKPYDVHRVLNFKTSDYHASSRQAMKYAQGYGLFVYLWEDDTLRPKFIEYLLEAMGGKGQASSFRKIFRRELDQIEKGHLEVR